ncbi:MAG: efflux RND transporter periplasmic adaptor subunit [Bacteroidales bacterium]
MRKYILALLVPVVWACSPATETEEAHNHEAEPETEAHTVFTNSSEFFVEHPVLLEGEEAGFRVHVTRLSDYRPYEGSLQMNVNGNPLPPVAPQQPGIFLVPVTPKEHGEAHIDLVLEHPEGRDAVHLHVHVGEAGEDHDHAGEAGAGHLHEEGEDSHNHPAEVPALGVVTFLKEQAWKSDFRVDPVQKEALTEVTPTSGELLPAPGKISSLSAPVRGVVHFVDPNLVQGGKVARGSHLFTIRGSDLPGENLELELARASTRLDESRQRYQRHALLEKNGAVSRRTLEESRTAYVNDSLYRTDLARLGGPEGVRVSAAASGSIHELSVSEGMFIEAGTNLLTLSSDRFLLLRADLPQQFADRAADIASANFRLTYGDQTLAMEEFHGKHLSTGLSVAENNHYLPVYFELENDGRLMEGAFAEVYLLSAPSDSAVVIPNSALLEELGNLFVYVQVGGETYRKQIIRAGRTDGLRTEVLEGLHEGDRIVTRGPVLLKAASVVVGTAAHDHSH